MAVGRVDVDQMLDELAPLQWEEWKLVMAKRPFGPHRDDLRAAINTKALELILFKFLNGFGSPDLDIDNLMIGYRDGDDEETDPHRLPGREDPAVSMAKLELLSKRFNRGK